MTAMCYRSLILVALLAFAHSGYCQAGHEGTAVIQTEGNEYTIPIVCEDTARPELGFYTEPQRITRERTGRASQVRLTVRPWKDTSDLSVSLGRYVAWVPSQSSTGGILKMTFSMSPASYLEEGTPIALTYEDWSNGKRPGGLENVSVEANCSFRDPNAPAFRKL